MENEHGITLANVSHFLGKTILTIFLVSNALLLIGYAVKRIAKKINNTNIESDQDRKEYSTSDYIDAEVVE